MVVFIVQYRSMLVANCRRLIKGRFKLIDDGSHFLCLEACGVMIATADSSPTRHHHHSRSPDASALRVDIRTIGKKLNQKGLRSEDLLLTYLLEEFSIFAIRANSSSQTLDLMGRTSKRMFRN